MIEVDNVVSGGEPVFRPAVHQKERDRRDVLGTFVVDYGNMMTTMAACLRAGRRARAGHGHSGHRGRQARRGVHRQISRREGQAQQGAPIEIPDNYSDDEVVEHRRFAVEELDIEKRKTSFDEVILAITSSGRWPSDALPALRQE
jgi:hypothetical protein